MSRFRRTALSLAVVLPLLLSLVCFLAPAMAKRVTLAWEANTEPDLEGYRLYYKTGSSGDRVLTNYDGAGLTFVGAPYDGEPAASGFSIRKEELPQPDAAQVRCSLSGLHDDETYYFVVTAYDTEHLESEASNEVSTADLALALSGSGGGGGCLVKTAAACSDFCLHPILLLGFSAGVVLALVVAWRRKRQQGASHVR
jgi:hypothetical protein